MNNATLKAWFQSLGLLKQAGIIFIAVAILVLSVSAVIRHFTVWKIERDYKNGMAEKDAKINEAENKVNQIQTAYDEKESEVQKLEGQVFELEKTIVESNKRLEEISKKVLEANTNYERAKVDNSIGNTIDDMCEALEKVGRKCT